MDFDFESESMTPPSSPVIGYSGSGTDYQSTIIDADLVYCFCCKGPIKAQDPNFSTESYLLRTGAISAINVLNSSVSTRTRKKPCLYKFFGRKFDPTSVSQLKKIILISRKNVTTLSIFSQNSIVTLDEDVNFWNLRKDVCIFLNFLISWSKCGREELGEEQFKELFHGFVRSLGKIKDWSGSLKNHCGYKHGNDCSAALYHHFHMQLELRWAFLILFNLDDFITSWFFQDLFSLALFLYEIKDHTKKLMEVTPFNCYCVKELWTMTKLCVDEIKPNNKSFWEMYACHLSNFIAKSEEIDLFFPLWLTYHLVPLSNYSLYGSYITTSTEVTDTDVSNNCYPYIVTILKEWAKRGGKTIELNNLTYRLLTSWGFNYDVAIIFYNHWLPKIDKNLEVMDLDCYSSVEKWMALIRILTNNENTMSEACIENKLSSDSFLSFIRLFVGHAKLSTGKDWKKLKSNIFMKMTPKVVSEFGEIGLLRMSTLYLSVAYATPDTLFVCDRLMELLKHAIKGTLRQKTILRALSTTLLVLLNKSVPITSICNSYMSTISTYIANCRSDSQICSLAMVYIELLETLTLTPNFSDTPETLGRPELISNNFTLWLLHCGLNNATRTLRSLHKLCVWVLNQSRSENSDSMFFGDDSERKKFISVLGEKIFPFLTDSVLMHENRAATTDIEPYTDVAVDLTVLTKNYEFFYHCVLNDRVLPEMTGSYVSKLFEFPDFCDTITELKWSQIWIRMVSLGCNIPIGLTAKVLSTHDTTTTTYEESPVVKFCAKFLNSSTCDVNVMLKPVVSLCQAVSSGGVFKESNFRHVVKSVVKTCSLLFTNFRFEQLYVKKLATSVCALMLDSLFPSCFGAFWDRVNSNVVASLRFHSYEFFTAISKNFTSDSAEEDVYLKRKLIDIVTWAVICYPVPFDKLDEQHPGFKILEYIYQPNSQNVSPKLTTNIMSALNTFGKDSKTCTRFLSTVNQCRMRGLKLATIGFLPGVISAFVVSQTDQKQIRSRINSIILYCCSLGSDLYREKVHCIFKEEMESQFALRSRQFLLLFEMLVSYAQKEVRLKDFLSQYLMPLLRMEIENCEMLRGHGIDNSLRGPLQKMEGQLSSI